MRKCEALYISSDRKSVIVFDFKFDFIPDSSIDSLKKLTTSFRKYVSSLGKDALFPDEITGQLSDNGINCLLIDCEFRPDSAFFLVNHSEEHFFSLIDGKRYRMCGNNGIMTAFETLEGGSIGIVRNDGATDSFIKI